MLEFPYLRGGPKVARSIEEAAEYWAQSQSAFPSGALGHSLLARLYRKDMETTTNANRRERLLQEAVSHERLAAIIGMPVGGDSL